QLHVFVGHTKGVHDAVFSPDGRYILTGSYDGTARLWDEATGTLVRTFSGHSSSVMSVAFSPDGQYILTGSEDRTVRLWDMDYHVVIVGACARLSRDFTDAERKQFSITDTGPTCP